MIANPFSRTAPHKHAEPAQRLLGVERLPPDSDELAALLAADPAPEVRAAAAQRCAGLEALAAALAAETESSVREAIASALARTLAAAQDSARARAVLEQDGCADAVRAEVARLTADPQHRAAAIGAIRDEAALVELALHAEHAGVRIAAAERVLSPAGLQKLADAAKHKDRGVARLARQRIDAMNNRLWQQTESDAIAAQLEALALETSPILFAVAELDRRWQALNLAGDADRLARVGAARQRIQARFEAEQEAHRARAHFERRLHAWIAALRSAVGAAQDALAARRGELESLRSELASLRGAGAQQPHHDLAFAQLDEAEQHIRRREEELQALASAEAMVAEAERLAAENAVDDGEMQTRWQGLDRAVRTADLTRRFEAALLKITQRRLAQTEAAKQDMVARRHRLHGLLHAAEQALAAGQLQAARAAADESKALKAGSGELPKPTAQRLGRVLSQLAEMERWESFGQHNARVQLCERAEGLAAQAMDAARLAQEVRKLREEWKALDQQHPGVPKALWQRFDAACEKAYAPAARHFAELSARNKEARKRREAFIAAAAEHAPTLLGERPDWRALENWLRETDHAWREGSLGSVDPAGWKKLDAQLKVALAPARHALSAARAQAKAEREALIAEAAALTGNATERDAPSRVKLLQARWQEQAKALPLARRDEQALWERFRSACDAVFQARQAKRKEEDTQKQEIRRGLEDICAQLEQLAQATDKDDQDVRRSLRELQQLWARDGAASGPALRSLEPRYGKAKAAVDAMLSARVRSRDAAVWETLMAKERLCHGLESLVQAGASESAAQSAEALERWAALPALQPTWEKKMAERRDAALRALSDGAAAGGYLVRLESGAESRRQRLLELELLLGLDSPAECQGQRRALQMKKLQERFRGTAATGGDSAVEQLLSWCAQPGVADDLDRERCERIVSRLAPPRAKA